MRTIIPSVMAPVFVLVLMTFILLFMMGFARVNDLRARRLRISGIALGQNAWPERTLQIGNAFNNQFQLPVLFYALVAFVLLTGKHDYLFIAGEWLFVILRIGHALIHITSNNVQQRFAVYVGGVFVLVLMWIWYAIRILAAI
jgi:hypothetical protein